MQVVDWQIIIEKHGAIVWQTAYRLLGNYTDTSDCFQETFISALKVCKRQKVRNFPALLARLATTRAIDMLRVRFRLESNNLTNDFNMGNLNNNPDPAKYVQKQELATKLQKALVQLPIQEAQVFCMRYLNDMSYRRIAKELNIKTNTVGVLLYRAKEKLRKSFSVLQNQQKSEVVL
ncbi:MAG: RNA polymerase sigma factor [Sedimentisphaerales bacterium]|nr:RNA polymerase sigma factor [Sedimentisphaerales bacterium]